MADYSILLIASRPPPTAGQSIATEILTGELNRHRVHHQVLDLSSGLYPQAKWWGRVRRAGRVLSFPLQFPFRVHQLQAPTVCYLQLGQGHAAFLRDLPLLALANFYRLPTVLHVHGGGFRRAYDTAPVMLRRAMRRAIGRARRVIVLSDSLRAMFDGLAEPDRIRVVANGVEREVESAAARVPLPPRTGHGLTILYLSNLHPTKGYPQVLEAARRCAQQRLPHRFVLAGAITPSTTVDPDRFIAEHRLNNTTYVGPADRQRKIDLLAEADAVVLPTSYAIEGQPIVLLEAMHFGLALITSRAGGIPHMIDEPQNGLFVEPDQSRQIFDAVQRLHLDRELLRWMAKNNRALATEHYTAASHGRAMLRAFDEVLAGTD